MKNLIVIFFLIGILFSANSNANTIVSIGGAWCAPSPAWSWCGPTGESMYLTCLRFSGSATYDPARPDECKVSGVWHKFTPSGDHYCPAGYTLDLGGATCTTTPTTPTCIAPQVLDVAANLCVTPDPSVAVGQAAYDRAINMGYSVAAAVVARDAAIAAYNTGAGATSIQAAGDIAAKIVNTGGSTAGALSTAAAAIDPASLGYTNNNFQASAENCSLAAAARGAGFSGQYVDGRCVVIQGDSTFIVTLAPVAQEPFDSAVAVAAAGSAFDLAIDSNLDFAVSGALVDYLASAVDSMTTPTNITSGLGAGQSGINAVLVQATSPYDVQLSAGRAAIDAYLSGSSPAAQAVAAQAAAIAKTAGYTDAQAAAAGQAAAAAQMLSESGASTSVSTGVAAAGTTVQFPGDYAKTGEAATAAAGLGTKLDTLHGDLTTQTTVADPPALTGVDMPGMGSTFDAIKGWTLPTHTSTCPQPQIDLSGVLGAGRVFTLSTHCQLAQDHFPVLQAAMMVVWTIAAMFVVLKA